MYMYNMTIASKHLSGGLYAGTDSWAERQLSASPACGDKMYFIYLLRPTPGPGLPLDSGVFN